LIQSPECGSGPVFPAGLEVDGEIASVHKVGLGVLRETATLEIRFTRIVTSAGKTLPIAADVVEIDNARETLRHGVIHGIRATNSPQGRLTSGLIHLPTLNPYAAIGLVAYRAFTVLPEPEIYLPPGSDLRLSLDQPLFVGDQPELPRVSFQMDEYERGDVEMAVERVPDRTTTIQGKDADLINVMFVGSKEQLSEAFAAAGWLPADRNSPRSVFRQMGAVFTFSNYPTMPFTRQRLNGQLQELTWQKSFNSYAKREHVRVWSQSSTILGQQAWLSAYTRETSGAFSLKYRNFIHHIDRNLDEGVNMLVRDLSLSGCVDSVFQLPRPQIDPVLINSTGDEMRTDGNLTVVHLQHCDRPAMEDTRRTPSIEIRPRSRFVRYFRNQILLYKSDFIRGNIIYAALDLGCRGVRAFVHRHSPVINADYGNLPMSPVSPQTLFPITVPAINAFSFPAVGTAD
jgi:LssY C-terminus